MAARYEASPGVWISRTCELLQSNLPMSHPLCIDLSTGWPMDRREEDLLRILDALSTSTSVRHLKLKNITLTSQQRTALEDMFSSNQSLRIFDIENVRDSGRASLSFPKALFEEGSMIEELNIQRCRLDATTTALLGQATIHSRLRCLQLNDVIFESGVTSLIAPLQDTNNHLESLAITITRLDSYLPMLLDSLASNRSLTNIILDSVNLGDDHASQLAAILRNNPRLETLKLPGNNLGSDSMECLAKGLADNTSLRTLALAYNPVGDEGAKALVEVLTKKNRTLKELNLDYCEIWHDGCRNLAANLADMRGIVRLGLEGNDLEQCATALLQSVVRNRTIEHISGFQALAFGEGKDGKWKSVERFLRLNRGNHRALLASPKSLPLLPHLLEQANKDADMVFHLISSQPHIVQGRGNQRS